MSQILKLRTRLNNKRTHYHSTIVSRSRESIDANAARIEWIVPAGHNHAGLTLALKVYGVPDDTPGRPSQQLTQWRPSLKPTPEP
eukprot:4414092-Amphidinium_carterae.1